MLLNHINLNGYLDLDPNPNTNNTGLNIWGGVPPVGRLGTTLNPGVYSPRFEWNSWDGGQPTYTSPIWLRGRNTGFFGLNVWLEIERLL